MCEAMNFNFYGGVKDNTFLKTSKPKAVAGLNLFNDEYWTPNSCNKNYGINTRFNMNIGNEPGISIKSGPECILAGDGKFWYGALAAHLGGSVDLEIFNKEEKEKIQGMVNKPIDDKTAFGYKTEAFADVDVTFSGSGYNAGNFDGYVRAGIQGGISYKGVALMNTGKKADTEVVSEGEKEPFLSGLDIGGDFDKVTPYVKPYIEGQANIMMSRRTSIGLFARGEYTVPIQEKSVNVDNNGYKVTGGIRIALH